MAKPAAWRVGLNSNKGQESRSPVQHLGVTIAARAGLAVKAQEAVGEVSQRSQSLSRLVIQIEI
jgi:hypothetical protein